MKRRSRRGEAFNGLATLFLTAGVGIALVFLFRETQWADEVTIGDEAFSNLDSVSMVVFGVVASSFGALLYDVKKAIDDRFRHHTHARRTHKSEKAEEWVASLGGIPAIPDRPGPE